MGTLHEDQYTFMIIPCSVLLRVRNISDKSCRENQSTYRMFNNFFPPINLAVYNMEKCGRVGQATIDNMRHALCMLNT